MLEDTITRARRTSLHSVAWPQGLRWTITCGHPWLLSQLLQRFVSNLEKFVGSCQQRAWMAEESVATLGPDVELSGLVSHCHKPTEPIDCKSNANTEVLLALICLFLRLMWNLPGAEWTGRFTQNSCKVTAKSSPAVVVRSLPQRRNGLCWSVLKAPQNAHVQPP